MAERGCCEWIERGHVLVGRLVGPDLLEGRAVRAATDELNRMGQASGGRKFVLDFGRVARMSSPMMGELLVFQNQVQQTGGQLAVSGLNADIQASLNALQMDRLLRIYTTEVEAVAAL
jgi:anti-anti-sigma factor